MCEPVKPGRRSSERSNEPSKPVVPVSQAVADSDKSQHYGEIVHKAFVERDVTRYRKRINEAHGFWDTPHIITPWELFAGLFKIGFYACCVYFGWNVFWTMVFPTAFSIFSYMFVYMLLPMIVFNLALFGVGAAVGVQALSRPGTMVSILGWLLCALEKIKRNYPVDPNAGNAVNVVNDVNTAIRQILSILSSAVTMVIFHLNPNAIVPAYDIELPPGGSGNAPVEVVDHQKPQSSLDQIVKDKLFEVQRVLSVLAMQALSREKPEPKQPEPKQPEPEQPDNEPLEQPIINPAAVVVGERSELPDYLMRQCTTCDIPFVDRGRKRDCKCGSPVKVRCCECGRDTLKMPNGDYVLTCSCEPVQVCEQVREQDCKQSKPTSPAAPMEPMEPLDDCVNRRCVKCKIIYRDSGTSRGVIKPCKCEKDLWILTCAYCQEIVGDNSYLYALHRTRQCHSVAQNTPKTAFVHREVGEDLVRECIACNAQYKENGTKQVCKCVALTTLRCWMCRSACCDGKRICECIKRSEAH